MRIPFLSKNDAAKYSRRSRSGGSGYKKGAPSRSEPKCTLVFGVGLDAADLRVTRSGSNGYDAKLSFAGKAGSVTLRDEFYGVGWSPTGVEQVQFGDGVVWGKAELLNACIA